MMGKNGMMTNRQVPISDNTMPAIEPLLPVGIPHTGFRLARGIRAQGDGCSLSLSGSKLCTSWGHLTDTDQECTSVTLASDKVASSTLLFQAVGRQTRQRMLLWTGSGVTAASAFRSSSPLLPALN